MNLKNLKRRKKTKPEGTKPASAATRLDELAQLLARSTPSPAEFGLREFVASIPNQPDRIPDRRRSARHSLLVDIVVLPLDLSLRPVGPAFTGCCRTISTGGICLFHGSQTLAEFVYVEIRLLDVAPMQALVKVLRQRPADRFFELAGEFVQQGKRAGRR
jgi:hypothetical protein